MSKQVSICVIGSGYVGLVAAVCFAEIGHKVICGRQQRSQGVLASRRAASQSTNITCRNCLAKHLNRGIEFTTDLATAVEQSEAIFVAVGTPQGNTGSADLSYVEAVVSEIARSRQ